MPITTPSMGLKRWDQPNDVFSYTELSENFNLIDQHDHSPGKGVQIPTNGLANLAVTETKLANDAVATGKIANLAVTNAKIADGTIALSKLVQMAKTRIRRTTPVAFASPNAILTISLETIDFEVGEWWSTGASITVPESGYYYIAGTSEANMGAATVDPWKHALMLYNVTTATVILEGESLADKGGASLLAGNLEASFADIQFLTGGQVLNLRASAANTNSQNGTLQSARIAFARVP